MVSLVIDRRFRGPPNSGNGGYVCGCLARYVAGDAEVTLRAPPPLERPLDVLTKVDGGIELRERTSCSRRRVQQASMCRTFPG